MRDELRKDQIVHLVEGVARKGQVPPPVDIVQKRTHGAPPKRSFFVLSYHSMWEKSTEVNIM